MTTPDLSSLRIKLAPTPGHPGWFHGRFTDIEEGKEFASKIRNNPTLTGYQILIGAMGGDSHRFFVIPASATVADIAQGFQIGSHGFMGDGEGFSNSDTNIASILQAVHKICPFFVTFADAAGLHGQFTRKVTASNASEIEALFESNAYPGCEALMADWDGDGSLFKESLLNSEGLKLWWD